MLRNILHHYLILQSSLFNEEKYSNHTTYFKLEKLTSIDVTLFAERQLVSKIQCIKRYIHQTILNVCRLDTLKEMLHSSANPSAF